MEMILFIIVDPKGQVMEKYWNEGTNYPHTKYYYSSAKECKLYFIVTSFNYDYLFIVLVIIRALFAYLDRCFSVICHLRCVFIFLTVVIFCFCLQWLTQCWKSSMKARKKKRKQVRIFTSATKVHFTLTYSCISSVHF